jgi:hypothetical protein
MKNIFLFDFTKRSFCYTAEQFLRTCKKPTADPSTILHCLQLGLVIRKLGTPTEVKEECIWFFCNDEISEILHTVHSMLFILINNISLSFEEFKMGFAKGAEITSAVHSTSPGELARCGPAPRLQQDHLPRHRRRPPAGPRPRGKHKMIPLVSERYRPHASIMLQQYAGPLALLLVFKSADGSSQKTQNADPDPDSSKT